MHSPDQSARLNWAGFCVLHAVNSSDKINCSHVGLFIYLFIFGQRWPELFQILNYLNLISLKPTHRCLWVGALVCADSAQLVIRWARREADTAVLTCWLHLILWTLSLTLLTGEGSWETHSWMLDYFHPYPSSAPLWVECDNLGVVEPVCSLCRADPSSLWLHGSFSCVNAFVLLWHVPARGQILVSVSSAVCPLSFKHICVTRGFI